MNDLFGKPVEVIRIIPLGAEPGETELKGFGYGKPYLIDFILKARQSRSSCLPCESRKASATTRSPIGRHRCSGRTWHSTCCRGTSARMDVGFFTKYGGLKSAGDADEFFILMDRVSGIEYYRDLDRIAESGFFTELDCDRAKALSDNLVYIHQQKHDDRVLWDRRIRELVGSGECIMGLDDSYPDDFGFYSAKDLRANRAGVRPLAVEAQAEISRACPSSTATTTRGTSCSATAWTSLCWTAAGASTASRLTTCLA